VAGSSEHGNEPAGSIKGGISRVCKITGFTSISACIHPLGWQDATVPGGAPSKM
jgi:hypothetical protein